MALTWEEAVALARQHAPLGLLEDQFSYGEGRYEFAKVMRDQDVRTLGDSSVIVIDEETQQVYTGSSAPGLAPIDVEIRDFSGEIIRTRAQVREAYKAFEAEQAALEAMEDDEPGEPVPVEHPYI